MARRTVKEGLSRNKRRASTKSSVRITCQRQTAGARNRARKSVAGTPRVTNREALIKAVNNQFETDLLAVITRMGAIEVID